MAERRLYYKLPLRYQKENNTWVDTTDLYADSDYTQPVGTMTSTATMAYSVSDTTDEITNTHPKKLSPLYVCKKLIEIYNNDNDPGITNRRFVDIEYVADSMFPIVAKINHKKGFPNLTKVIRVIRRVDPEGTPDAKCHGMLVFKLRK